MKALLDFIPLIVFFVLANQKNDILLATQGLLIAVVAVTLLQLILQKGKLLKSQWIVLGLTLVFGGLTLLFHDDVYIRWKSTVINLVFAAALVGSLFIGQKSLGERLLEPIFQLDRAGWRKVTLSIAGYFIVMALLHYLFAFVPALMPYWVSFKTFGGMIINIAAIALLFASLRHNIRPELRQR